MAAARKPQINFQVNPPLKMLYEEARAQGHWVTRFCAAGLLLLVEDASLRAHAISRLREWESRYANADPDDIRRFVEGAQAAMRGGAPGSQPGPKARAAKKKAKRG